MTENIFLSYRRDDSRGYTNAIYTLLELHFDNDQIFMDVDTLVPGSDFVQCLEDAVESCDIFLAIIGLRWENIKDNEGNRRLANPEDFVRIEVAHALKRGIPVIPVLVDGAEMPSSEDLPDNLKELARRHAFSIGDYMRTDVQHLIKVLEKTFESLEQERIKLERAEEERKTREQAAKEKKAAEEKEQLALQKAEAERLEKAQVETERLEKAQVETERLEKERVESERLEKEKADTEHLEKERAEAGRLENERTKAERLEKERAEAGRLEKERVEAERLEKERVEAERLEKERAEAGRLENERTKAERLKKEKAESERLEKERAVAERKEKARAEAVRKEIIKAEAELERLALQREEAERKAKKEADKKAKELALAEKKVLEKRERIARREARKKVQKTTEVLHQPSPGTAQQVEKVVSQSSASSQLVSVLKMVPVWGWGIGVVTLLLIGFVAAGGFALSSPGEQGLSGIFQAFAEPTNTPTPVPETPTFTPTPSLTPAPPVNFSVAASIVLSYIAEHSPTFEDNFATPKTVWGFDNEEFITFFSPKGKVLIVSDAIPENNELLLDNDLLGFSFPTNGIFDAANFWLEFDCNLAPDDQKLDEMGIVFRAAQDQSTSYRFKFVNRDSNWGWDFVQMEIDGSLSLMASGDIDISSDSIFNNFIFVVFDNHLLFFMNSTLVFETDNIALNGNTNQFFGAGSDAASALLDSVRFWDLEGLEINQ